MLDLKLHFERMSRRKLYPCLAVLFALNACSSVGKSFSNAYGLFSSRVVPVTIEQRCEPANALRLSMLDVGQATALLVQCPDGVTQALIDAGNSNFNSPHAEEKFRRAFYEKMGADRHLELAVATHPDLDHVTGFAGLMQDASEKKFSIDTYVDNGAKRTTQPIDEEVRVRANSLGVRYLNAPKDAVTQLTLCPAVPGVSEAVAIDFYYPTGALRDRLHCETNFNGCSLMNRFSYAGHTVFLAADRSIEDEALLTDAELAAANAEVLLVGHHGNHSSSIRFLRAVSPDLALLSTGTPKEAMTTLWGYPNDDVLDRLLRELPVPRLTSAHGELERREIDTFVLELGWEKARIPVNLISTTIDGTTDLYLSTAGICVNREKSPTSLRFGKS